jgi:formamidopyrimidine-DNA glycosylase
MNNTAFLAYLAQTDPFPVAALALRAVCDEPEQPCASCGAIATARDVGRDGEWFCQDCAEGN